MKASSIHLSLVASRWGHPAGRVCGFPHSIGTKPALVSCLIFLQNGVPLSGLDLWSDLEWSNCYSWALASGPALPRGGLVILWSVGLLCSGVGSTFYCPRFWRGLCVWPSSQRRSGSWPFFFWPCCLSPSSGVGSASAAWQVISFTWALPCVGFPAWLAC